MLPFFSPLSNQIQARGQAPHVDPSLQQAAMFNQSQFSTPPGVNFGIPNSNLSGFSASNAPAGLPPPIPMASASILGCPNVLPMMQNNQAGFFPHQSAPFGGAPQNMTQQLLGLQLLGQSCGMPQNVQQFQGQLQGLNILGSLLANNLPQNFNFVGGLPNGQMCLPTMMTQGNQFGVLNSPAQPCLGSNHPEIVGNCSVPSIGNKNTSFSKSALPTERTKNSFSHDDRHGHLSSKKLHQPMSCSPMKNHHSMKHNQPGDFRPQVSGVGGNDNSPKNSPRNFRGRGKTEQRRFQKPHFQNVNGRKSNMRRFNGAGGRGQKNWREGEPQVSEFSKPFLAENRRRLPLSYNETEIHQWIEARKKNYPSKANVEKKLAQSGNEGAEDDVKLRREQLKEVLAKQAELGVEVAEIPPGYLSDSEKQPLREGNDLRACHTPDHFPNKHNHKRGRHNQDRWKTKRPKFRNDSSDTSVPFVKRRQQTLLRKLLSTDIKRDNCRLLQILRFTVLNSFFDHLPEKPLEFPSITVKDMQCESGAASEKPSDPTCSGMMKFGDGKSSLVKEVEGTKATWNADDAGSASESEPNYSNNSEMDCSMITEEHA
ncbi:uncharacterized protein LOC121993140 [Zingiber officinale]|uniref:FMR1-interacting protein 1 conserved domain-containing protein n=1 Tax=Zingiber officinale TaxID=94328 RepID=A0A8J5FX88_ZINOF|nr:uncharacterized protein LOC121993140 [Zingiber officinale]KAG6496605.1 hypothetical protein ZIOFF_044474 [Zingiber officinale]